MVPVVVQAYYTTRAKWVELGRIEVDAEPVGMYLKWKDKSRPLVLFDNPQGLAVDIQYLAKWHVTHFGLTIRADVTLYLDPQTNGLVRSQLK